ncbi:phosphate/phosphite/phosphonate ABC transporter substrate-binding protein [Sulfurimonas sp.]|uniref:phosphate/phosphite/phosphonate ABC transporter substrate-binding protein n=1 Tax=Sulfurimonas sp. TaxID=2022749 RepID=UPI0019E1A011|nr:phosphate/phosphite/phosphonate ABC transporter substrate-binding protein [Sulfurimonas sp.]MBE0515218.1 phosphate/phosphite/phosphonate ABC transporter substrate-binding protein [Sulfurimonas sp.]
MKKIVITTLIGLSVLSSVAAAKECLTLGLIPAEDPKAMLEQYKPMAQWLEKETGQCIELKASTDYTGVIEAMRAKKVDIAWFGPFSYAMAAQRAGAEAFAVGINSKGITTYKSYLVATPEVVKALDITTPLVGLEGMKQLNTKLTPYNGEYLMAFTDVASTSGYAAPRYFMYKAGIDPKKTFKKVSFTGTHDAAELVIKNKIMDIVADNDISYPKMLESGKISKETNVVIWESSPLPGSPLAYRGDLDSDIKEKIKNAIVKVPKNIVTGYGKITGYKIVDDKEFDIIKDMKKVIDEVR